METGDIDLEAQRLAQKIGGLPSQKVDGFGNREFDAVSNEYIAQTTAAASASRKPHNYLNSGRRAQIQQTLEAAKQENKAAYFEFTFAEPHEDVKELIRRKAARLGVLAEIVW